MFLGDLVRAVAGLRPRDAATAAAMARVLGLDGGAAAVSPDASAPRPRTVGPRRRDLSPSSSDGTGPGRPGDGRSAHVSAEVRPPRSGNTDEAAPTRSARHAVRLTERPVDFSLAALNGFRPAAAHTSDRSAPDASASELLGRGTAGPGQPHEPPWKQGWARGIMFATVAAPLESRELDERSLVRRVARLDTVRSVPRHAAAQHPSRRPTAAGPRIRPLPVSGRPGVAARTGGERRRARQGRRLALPRHPRPWSRTK